MAYISSDGTSLFYRAASSSQPLAGIPTSGSATGGTFTMSIDYCCNSYANGAAGSIYGFKFPITYANKAGTWGGSLGCLFQDSGTWESLGAQENSQGQYPGFNSGAVTFAVAGVVGNGTNGFLASSMPGIWFRQIATYNNRAALSRLQGFIAARGHGTWQYRRENPNNAAGSPSFMTHLSIGGRYRLDTTSALTLTAAPTAATSGTLTAAWTGMTDTRWRVTFNGGTVKTGVSLTNGSTAISWTGAVTDASPNLTVNDKFPDAFIQTGTMVANAAIWDNVLSSEDIHSLLNWEDPMRISRRPFEFYPMKMDEGLSPRDICNGFQLTHYTSPYDMAAPSGTAAGTGLKYFPSSGQTMSGRAYRDPPVYTAPMWSRDNFALLAASGIAPAAPVVAGSGVRGNVIRSPIRSPVRSVIRSPMSRH